MRRLLASRDARLYLGGQCLSTFGDSTLWLAAAIWVKVLTHSSSLAGLTFFFMAAPALAAPLAGLVVDRVRRRPLLIAINLGTGAAVLLLLLVRDPHEVWLIWSVMAAYGLSNTLLGPGQSALLTAVVPPEQLADANGALQAVAQGQRLVTPLIGAGLFAWLGGGTVALLDAVTFGVAALTLLLLRVEEPTPEARRERWGRAMAAGARHLWRVRDLRQLVAAAALFMGVIGLFETLGFAVAAKGLHRPPTFVGVIVAVQGIGALFAAPTAAPVIRRAGEVRLAGLGMLSIALASVLYAAPVPQVVLAGSILLGLGLPWLVVSAVTLLQRRTPAALQGRAFAAFDVALGVPQTMSIALGAAIVAVVPYRLLLGGSAVLIAMAGAWLVTRRRLREAREERGAAEASA